MIQVLLKCLSKVAMLLRKVAEMIEFHLALMVYEEIVKLAERVCRKFLLSPRQTKLKFSQESMV